MKKIYVTIAEFLENGGTMVMGRKMFELNDIGVFEKSWAFPEDDYKLSDMAKENYYVEIDCTPHYA